MAVAIAVGMRVGYYTSVKGQQAFAGNTGPYPAIVEGMDADGRTYLWVFHLNAMVECYQYGSNGLGKPPWTDYWNYLPGGIT